MRFFNSIAFALAASIMAAPLPLPNPDGGPTLAPTRQRHKGKGQQNKRGKGATAKPAKRPNMRHVSKRVRRKHRRQAA